MAIEIADSDEESDFEKSNLSTVSEGKVHSKSAVLHVTLNAFISHSQDENEKFDEPTLAREALGPSQDVDPKAFASGTGRSQPMLRHKRTWSEGGSDEDNIDQLKVKRSRVKTYNRSNKCASELGGPDDMGMSDFAQANYADMSSLSNQPSQSSSEDQATGLTASFQNNASKILAAYGSMDDRHSIDIDSRPDESIVRLTSPMSHGKEVYANRAETSEPVIAVRLGLKSRMEKSVINKPQTEAQDNLRPKKRGRNAKNKNDLSSPFDKHKVPLLDPTSHVEIDKPSCSLSKRQPNAATPEVEDTTIKDPSSPQSQLAREVNLSDELFVGLPKEQYKPRPSRSRSKKLLEDCGEQTARAYEEQLVTEKRQMRAKTRRESIFSDGDDGIESPLKALKKERAPGYEEGRPRIGASPELKTERIEVENKMKEDVQGKDPQPGRGVKLEGVAEAGEGIQAERGDSLARGVVSQVQGLTVRTEEKGESKQQSPPSVPVKRAETKCIVVDIPPVSTNTGGKRRGWKKREDWVNDAAGEEDFEMPAMQIEVGPDNSQRALLKQQKKRGRKKRRDKISVNDDTGTERAQGVSSEFNNGQDEVEKSIEQHCLPLSEVDNPETMDGDLRLNAGLSQQLHPSPSTELSAPVADPAQEPVAMEHGTENTPKSLNNSARAKARYRVGLSRKAPIPSLLRIVRRSSP